MRPSLIAGTFFLLTRLVPRWGSGLWRFWYDALARRDADGQLLFMNYGYDDGSRSLALQASDEPFRCAAQLYARAVRNLDLADKDLLEVGCGRGGGGSYLIRYGNLRSYIGVDISHEAISRCRRQHPLPQAQWLEGRADAIPVPAASVDIVVNIESSHSYPSMHGFLREVHRVLRPGGYFAFADLRTQEEMCELEAQIEQCGFAGLERTLITREVLCALNGMTGERETLIETAVPSLLRGAFRDFAGVRNSAVYNMLEDGQLVYFCWLLRKTASLRCYSEVASEPLHGAPRSFVMPWISPIRPFISVPPSAIQSLLDQINCADSVCGIVDPTLQVASHGMNPSFQHIATGLQRSHSFDQTGLH